MRPLLLALALGAGCSPSSPSSTRPDAGRPRPVRFAQPTRAAPDTPEEMRRMLRLPAEQGGPPRALSETQIESIVGEAARLSRVRTSFLRREVQRLDYLRAFERFRQTCQDVAGRICDGLVPSPGISPGGEREPR